MQRRGEAMSDANKKSSDGVKDEAKVEPVAPKPVEPSRISP